MTMAGKRPSAKAIGLMIAVFVLGGVVGSLGTYLAAHVRDNHRRMRIMDRLTRELQLTPSQQQQVQGILADGRKSWEAAYRKSQEEARPQYQAVHAAIRARIRALLTASQQPKFDAFLKQLDAERKAREKQQSH